MILKLLKWLIYLAILGFIALVIYAYAGPFFGADFTPTPKEYKQDIVIDAK